MEIFEQEKEIFGYSKDSLQWVTDVFRSAQEIPGLAKYVLG